jgi:hypothetical protein
MKVTERKFEITEELQCMECGRKYVYDLFWHRQYSVKMKESQINTRGFHALCSEHKLDNYGHALIRAYSARRIDDRDLEKMGLNLEELLE